MIQNESEIESKEGSERVREWERESLITCLGVIKLSESCKFAVLESRHSRINLWYANKNVPYEQFRTSQLNNLEQFRKMSHTKEMRKWQTINANIWKNHVCIINCSDALASYTILYNQKI